MAWLTTRSDEPVELLRQVGVHAVADRLSDPLNAPVDQRDALYETARSAMRCLESEAITRFVSPPHTWAQPPRDPVVELDLQQLVANYITDPARQPSPGDTVYLLTPGGPQSAAPVIAALVDHALRPAAPGTGTRIVRTGPAVCLLLDDPAHTCPLPGLPDLLSRLSAEVLVYLQSYRHGVAMWGQAGMELLWDPSARRSAA
jgi:hypothetical protein